MRGGKIALAVALWLAAPGCGSHIEQAPSPEEATKTPYGSWIRIETSDGIRTGELLAVSEDRIFVRTASGPMAIPMGAAQKVVLWRFDGEEASLLMSSFVGTVSTVSHGFFLVLSAPVWIIGGAIATTVEADAGEIEDPNIRELRKWARFPQGLPARYARDHGLRTGDPWGPGPSTWETPGEKQQPDKLPSQWETRPEGWQPPVHDAGSPQPDTDAVPSAPSVP